MAALLRANWFKACVFGTFLSLSLSAAALILSHLSDLNAILLCVAAVGLGLFIADFVSGVVHALADHFGETHTPVVGPLFIEPFRSHHSDPDAIVHESRWELCIPAMTSAIPALGAGVLISSLTVTSPASIFIATLLWVVPSCAVGACLTHQLAHHDSPIKLVGFLQRSGFILSVEQHQLHHREGHLTRFCILNGWANPAVDALLSRTLLRQSPTHKAAKALTA